MAAGRYVVLGLAQVRSTWFRDVARWATSAMLPVEFVKAMSVEEVRVRLRSGRGHSALLVDDTLAGLDRDLVALASGSGCAVIVVESGRVDRAWDALGASAVIPAGFGRDELLQTLTQVAAPIERTAATTTPPSDPVALDGYRGHLVAITGSGGAGRSTVAIAVAQHLARDPRNLASVCLADLALDAEQAVLHAAPDVVPGVLELVEAHRAGTLRPDEVERLTWSVRARGYHLLLGLRSHRDWTALRPRAFAAALDGLRGAFRLVVADVDADVEGERATGSLDVEERNTMARTATLAADLVLVLGVPGMKGVHRLLQITQDLLDHGVPPSRLVPVVNRAPGGRRARAELTTTFAALLRPLGEPLGVAGPLYLPERHGLDDVLRDGARVPEAWAGPVAGAVAALLERVDAPPGPPPEGPLEVVAPGTMGSWTEEEG
jgi:hypothetical protein